MLEALLNSLSATDFWIAVAGQITTDASAKATLVAAKLVGIALFGSLVERIPPAMRSVPAKRIRRRKMKSRRSKRLTSLRSRAPSRRT